MADKQEDTENEMNEEEQTVAEEKKSLNVIESVEAIDEAEKTNEEIETVTSVVRAQVGEENILEREQDAEVPGAAEVEIKSDDGADKQDEKPADEAEEKDVQRPEGEDDLGGDEERIKEGEEEEQILEEDEMKKETSKEVVEEGVSSRPESIIGARLSREETLEVEAATLQPDHDRPEAKSPVSEVAEKQETLVPEVEEGLEAEKISAEIAEAQRAELISQYFGALSVREKLQHQNYGLQHKIAEHVRKKKTEEVSESEKNILEHQQRYLKYMAQIEDLQLLEATRKENYDILIEDAKTRYEEQKSKADYETKKFTEQKQNVARSAINSITGKPTPARDIEQYFENQMSKELQITSIRLENIKLKNKMKKKQDRIKSKEELAEGLHMIDFEQLKIENQTYNEKIEERNEELLKFRKKITSTVQILTHLKEKLQYVQAENLEQNNELKEVEASLAQSRDILSRTKQARDALKIDNNKLRQKCGFLGNPSLLRDFEDQKDEGIELHTKLDQLKMKHANLTLQCNQVRQKVALARQTPL